MDEFEIVCNWLSDDDKKLDCLIACSPAKTKGIESVTAESCVCLVPKNNENDELPTKPELKIKSKQPLKELKVYSEASLIEIFGVYNEYLSTCKAEFIDDWEGLAVYHANVELPGITMCTLKFTRMKEKERLWLYSIQPTTGKLDVPNHKLFNFQNIINLLGSSLQTSEKTEDKKMVETQLKTSSINMPFRLPFVPNVTNREYNFQFQDCKKNLSTCLNSSGFLHPCDNSSKCDTSKSKLENEYLINYIDKKFTEMKVELINEIGINLAQLRNENNAKLEKIMKLIENTKM